MKFGMRTVGCVVGIMAEHGIAAEGDGFVFGAEASVAAGCRGNAFEGVVGHEYAVENHRQRQAVGGCRWPRACRHFRSHISRFAGYVVAMAVDNDILVVAYEDVAGEWICEEVAVVDVLVAASCQMQAAEAVGDGYGRIEARCAGAEVCLGITVDAEKVAQFDVVGRLKRHNITEGAPVWNGERLRP